MKKSAKTAGQEQSAGSFARPGLLFGALLLGAAVFVFRDFLLLHKTWLFKDIGSDSINLEYPHLVLMAGQFKQQLLPGWSFSQGLGQNMLPLALGGNLSALLFPFEGRALVYGLARAEFAKVLLSGLCFFLYLGELRLAPAARIAGGLMFAFSGYVILGGGWSIFSFEALCAALLLYAFERFFTRGDWRLLPLPFALLGLVQPFYWYSYSVFLLVYAGLRHYAAGGGEQRNLLLLYAKVFGLCLLGAAASGLFSLPSVWQMRQSPRIAGDASYFKLLFGQPMFGLTPAAEALTSLYRFFSSDLLGTGSAFRGFVNYLEAPMFYCGLPALLLLPQYFYGADSRGRRAGAAALALCALVLAFPFFRRLFWGFSGDYYRTLSLFIALCPLYFSLRALDGLLAGRRYSPALLAGWLALLLGALYYPWSPALRPEPALRAAAAALLTAYALLVPALAQGRFRKTAGLLFLALLAGEAAFFSSVTLNDRPVVTRQDLDLRAGYNDYTKEAAAWLKENDRDFYRVAKTYSSGAAMHASINDALVFGYRGTSSYHPFNQQAYVKFLGALGVTDAATEVRTRWLTGLERPFRPLLLTLTGVKYALSREPQRVAPFGYSPVYKAGDVTVLKNAFALPLGFTYSAYMPAADFLKLPLQAKDAALLLGCALESEAAAAGLRRLAAGEIPAELSFDQYARLTGALRAETLNLTVNSDSRLAGTITVKKPKLLFLSIPYDKGWAAVVDGRPARLETVNIGFMGLPLAAGTHTIDLVYTPPLMRAGGALSALALLAYAALLYRSRRNGPFSAKML